MAHVLFLHTDLEFVALVSARLSDARHTVSFHSEPMKALDILESDEPCDVLLTRIDFGHGVLNGIALARMARARRQSLRVVFTGRPEFEEFSDGEVLGRPGRRDRACG